MNQHISRVISHLCHADGYDESRDPPLIFLPLVRLHGSDIRPCVHADWSVSGQCVKAAPGNLILVRQTNCQTVIECIVKLN